ncbi:MAG: ABC transporter ATP-binding protein [Planctomycetota bacterium]|jgi:NitT/TauT family transport system ATP-binding protein
MHTEFVLECRGVSHWFGPHHVLHDVGFQVIRGEIVGLVGPSGCGKSTLLRAVVGTHPPERGDVLVYARGASAGTPVRGPGRDRGIVYQRYSLFPFLTAQENVAFGLMLDQTTIPFRLFKHRKWRKLRGSHLEEAAELLKKLGLERAIGLYPKQMSGGMCQRVAIAQALIMKPEILLLDEPFGALDEATREELQRMLLTLYLENRSAKQKGDKPPYTILIVTHELNEALYVGDRVLGLSQYWDWREKGHATPPGATIVYDSIAPVYLPDEQRDFEALTTQREEIRRAVFDPGCLQEREEFRVFWRQVHAGEGEGVLEQ